MNRPDILARLSFAPARALTLVLPLALAATTAARAQTEPAVPLDEFVVSTTRTPQDPRFMPGSVTLLSLDTLDTTQVGDLRDALAEQSGVTVVTSGPTGGQSSIFMRGASSHQTLFLVDGVRMNDRSAAYFNFLGGADLGGLGRVEVLRGPQSTLYGSAAMGGVVLLETAHGTRTPAGKLAVTAGSFDTFGGSAAARGTANGLAYSASLGRFVTANDAASNDFKNWSYSTRLELSATQPLSLGVTFRGQDGDYEETGSRFFRSPGVVDSRNHLGTAYAQWRAADDFSSRLTLGGHRRDYRFASAYGVSESRNTRRILDWQNTWTASRDTEVVSGANYERSRYTINGETTTDRVGAAFLSATSRVRPDATLTAGVRYDDFKSAGSATTWRAGLAWLAATNTKLRATYGTGFSAPGSDDRYGVAQWGQLANPVLRPEKSRGWDAGIDHTINDGVATLSATYFRNRFRDLFEWETVSFVTFEGHVVNRTQATADGVELGATVRPVANVHIRGGYTYLDARTDTTGARLIRRPRHTIDADTWMQATEAWMIGAGLHVSAGRVDNGGPIEDYTTARVFTSYRATKNLALKLRVENALDEKYEDVAGYASLPRGAFGSVEWTF